MSESFFGIIGAAMIAVYTAIKIYKPEDKRLIGVLILFGSFFAFAQNFALDFFRPLHQFIQIIFSLLFLINFNFSLGKFNKYFFVFLFFIFLSFVFTPTDKYAISAIINIFSVVIVINYIFSRLSSKSDLRIIFDFLAGAGIILAILGLFEAAFTEIARIEVTSANPNYYGLSLGICYICLATSNTYKHKTILLIVIALALILSGSRTALIAPILFHMWKSFITFGVLRTIFTSLMLAIPLLVLTVSFDLRVLKPFEADTSNAERLLITRVAVDMTMDNPLVGIGWGRFVSEWPNYTKFTYETTLNDGSKFFLFTDRARVTHNDFLKVSSELGLLALLFFIAMSLTVLRQSALVRETTLFGLFPILLTLIIFSLTHNNLNSFVFWFFFLIPGLKFLRVK